MKYWLFKSEASTYPIAQLARDKREWWDGVRNYQARNFMRDDMRVGDAVLFYHSSCPAPGVYGLAKVSKTAIPDVTQFDPGSDYYDPKATPQKPRWFNVQIAHTRTFKAPLPLATLRATPALSGMQILRPGNRLSITPVTKPQYTQILKLATA